MAAKRIRRQDTRILRTSPIFLSIFVLGLLATSLCALTISELLEISLAALRSVDVGDNVPDFVLSDTNGEEFSLADFRGKIVVVVFWRSGQERGLKALTSLQTVYTTFKDQGVEVVALSSDDGGLDVIRQVKREQRITFPMLYDKEEKEYGDYGVLVTPSTIIVNREGKLNYYYPGYRDDFLPQITGRIEILLGKKTLDELEAELNPVQRPQQTEAEKQAHRYLNAGNRLMEKGMVRSALAQYQKAVKENPDLIEAHLRLGSIYLELEKPEDAFAEFTQVIKSRPNSYRAYAGLGDALFFQEEHEKAIKMLRTALKLNPKFARAHYRLGRIYEERKQIEDALKEYKTALRLLLQVED